MLILTRKVNESIVIGSGVVVTVKEIRNGQVRIGIQAPLEVPVHRLEVWRAIHGDAATEALLHPPAPPCGHPLAERGAV